MDAGEACSQTLVGVTGSVLAVFPVRVKAKKGNKVLTCDLIQGVMPPSALTSWRTTFTCKEKT